MVRPKTDCYPISLEIGPTFLVYFKGLLIAYTSPVLFSNNDRALLRTWPMAICSRCTCHDHIHVLGHNDIALMKNGNTITTIWIISFSFFSLQFWLILHVAFKAPFFLSGTDWEKVWLPDGRLSSLQSSMRNSGALFCHSWKYHNGQKRPFDRMQMHSRTKERTSNSGPWRNTWLIN